MKKKEIAERFCKPENFESAPYMTIVKVIEGLGKDERVTGYYVQASKKDDEAIWLTMGEFLEQALEHLFENAQFIDEVSIMYEMSKYKNKSVFNFI